MRYFKKSLLIISLLISSLFLNSAFAINKKEIKKHYYLIETTGNNTLLYKNNQKSILVGSGYFKKGQLLQDFLIQNHSQPSYLINTHWHPDHTGGNRILGKNTSIIAHEQTRKRLESPQYIEFFKSKIEPYPNFALPTITFRTHLDLYLEGINIELTHYEKAHTDSDITVYFTEDNIIHLGDLYFSNMYPFIDKGSNGRIKNVIKALNKVIDQINDQTIIIPGHGNISNKKELLDYIKMLEISAKTVEQYKKSGLTLAEMQKKGLPNNLNEKWGTGFIKEASWIRIIFETL